MPWPPPRNISRVHHHEVDRCLQLQEYDRFFLLIPRNPTLFLPNCAKFTVACLVRIISGEDLCQPGISAR